MIHTQLINMDVGPGMSLEVMSPNLGKVWIWLRWNKEFATPCNGLRHRPSATRGVKGA